MKATIWVVVCKDRHTDDVVTTHGSRHAAQRVAEAHFAALGFDLNQLHENGCAGVSYYSDGTGDYSAEIHECECEFEATS